MKKMVSASCGCILFTLLISGCASVRVQNRQQLKNTYPPQAIYIRDYTFHNEGLSVDRSGKKLEDFRRMLATQLTNALQKEIQTKLVECRVLPAGKRAPQGPYWLITGRFDQVEQGSRMLRALVGFGLGKTKVSIVTKVYALAMAPPELIDTIKTIGTSGQMPGALPSVAFPPAGLVGAATTGMLQSSTSGLSFDVRRTAREITAALSQRICARASSN